MEARGATGATGATGAIGGTSSYWQGRARGD